MNEDRKKARDEHGIPNKIITSGLSGWAKALLILIPLVLFLLALLFR